MWFNGLRCCDCDNLDKSDKNKYGEAYCPVRREYVALDSYTCRDFDPNFYVMTAYCKINKLPCDCDLMTIMIRFRDSYMMNNENGRAFLEEYDGIGPVIASKLLTDVYRTDIVDEMEANYIKPVVSFIFEERNEEALQTYIDMIEMLKRRYGYVPIEIKGNEKTKRL